jgi:hypothetical protein
MKRTIIALSLALVPVLGHTVEQSEDDLVIVPQCDAVIVAQYAMARKADWLEVIDNLEQMGTMTKEWADEYRRLINEYYELKNRHEVQVWLAKNCK